jgi:hypothetical protein
MMAEEIKVDTLNTISNYVSAVTFVAVVVICVYEEIQRRPNPSIFPEPTAEEERIARIEMWNDERLSLHRCITPSDDAHDHRADEDRWHVVQSDLRHAAVDRCC